MSTVQSQNEEFEKAKSQIRGLVAEISQLAKSDLQPDEFYAAFLQRVIQALAAVGGAVWILGENKRPQLSYQINLSPTLLDPESDDATRHARLLDAVVSTSQPQLIPPLSGNEEGGNPTRNLLVVAPLGHDKQIEGLIEIFQRPNAQPNTQRGYLKFLLQMCEVAGEWFKNRKLRQLGDRHSLWAQADQFARLVHDSLDYRETAYTIVNEGRKLIGCDRVTVCVNKGGTCVVEAISGQDTLDNRSNVVHHLGTLATKVVASGETLRYNGSTEDMPPQIEKAIHDYVDESYTKSMVILPLRKPRPGDDTILQNESEDLSPREIIGALIVEQLEMDIPREVLEPRVDLVYEHAARALSNTIEHHSLFMMPVWKTIGKSRVVMQGRNLPKTVSITAAVLVGLLILSIPGMKTFSLKSKGSLQPINKQEVFAGIGGIIEQVRVDDGDEVKAGDILLTMKNSELEQQLEKLHGDIAAAQKKLQSSYIQRRNTDKKNNSSQEIDAQIPEIKEQIESLQAELRVKDEQREKLTVRAPINGRVVTWNAKENLLARPVEMGQVLMSIADENSKWRLELYMPERRAGKLRRADNEMREANAKNGTNLKVPVSYILMTDPNTKHTGVVSEIEHSTFVHDEEGPCVRVKVDLDDSVPLVSPRPNASLTAMADVGYCSVGYYYLHEAWEYLQANWLFM